MQQTYRSNIEDYLLWRGDLTFRERPFNPVDNLIFSVFAYLPLDDLVPSEAGHRGPTIKDVAEEFAKLDGVEIKRRGYSERILQHIGFFKTAAETKRFAWVRLSGFKNKFDKDVETQFAAVSFSLEDGSHYVAFRGTDATVIGWKEDLNMSFMTPVPAQKLAVEYLETAAKALHGKLRVGGHSKGGNLAVYAAAFSSWWTQRRITAVYNNDGPGFDQATIAKEGFRALQGRLFAYVPQSSIIGMLLEHSESYTIVQSTQKGIAQHDPYSWTVLGTSFVCVDTVTDTSRFIDKTLKEWLGALGPAERQRFVDALFDILEATDITSFSELSTNWFQRARSMGEAISSLDNESRTMLIKTLGLLFDTVKGNLKVLLSWELDREQLKKVTK
ncbi:MAG: DUF2974 domain-containing protein [Spirochaetota bacterium]